MNAKQKRVLKRIIIAAVLLAIMWIAEEIITDRIVEFSKGKKYLWLIPYAIPYFVIGYDILKKAGNKIVLFVQKFCCEQKLTIFALISICSFRPIFQCQPTISGLSLHQS